jgi:adenosylhomocysteine nucleosidase
MVSAGRVVRTPADRARLEGLAVDMESAALARAARDAGVPFLALRAVTDERGHRLPDFDRIMNAAGHLTPGAGLVHFVLHPREIPALLRLGPASRRAGQALREGMETLLGGAR